jgi:hypothetical protein
MLLMGMRIRLLLFCILSVLCVTVGYYCLGDVLRYCLNGYYCNYGDVCGSNQILLVGDKDDDGCKKSFWWQACIETGICYTCSETSSQGSGVCVKSTNPEDKCGGPTSGMKGRECGFKVEHPCNGVGCPSRCCNLFRRGKVTEEPCEPSACDT